MIWYNKYKISSVNPEIFVFSLNKFVDNINIIKDLNCVSIRDSKPSNKNKKLYQIIDNSNIKHLFISILDDLWDDSHINYGIIPDNKNISNIIQWATEIFKLNPKDFAVHCTAGVSRSSAISVLLNCLFSNIDTAVEKLDASKHYPNSRILEIGESIIPDTLNLKSKIKNKINEFVEKNPNPLIF